MASQFINGRYVEAKTDVTKKVIDPSTGKTIKEIDLGGAEDINIAVKAARKAFQTWSKTTPGERSALLYKFARAVEARADEFAKLESKMAGKPLRLTREFDVPGTIDNIDFFAGIARNLEGKATAEYSADHTSSIRREPVGVVGSISPWNYPLQMAAWKILPAIAAGNTIVLKPAEITPLTTLLFAEVATAAGIPKGVINVVVGSGSVAGSRLINHPDVDMLSFTGSTSVGRLVMQAGSTTAKRLHLELGGKAPFVVFDDADLEAAIHGAVAGSLINGGQDCTAATRAIVHKSVYKKFVDGVAELYSNIKLGKTSDMSTDMGPLVSVAHRDNVAAYVERARSYARVVVGGEIPGGELAAGSYYLPTLVADVEPQHEIFREELFGPVLTVTQFETDDEAFELANDTVYGLAASVWTKDLNRALRGTRDIKAGCVWVNDHIPIISEMPHGGVKQSGFGKDMSTYSLDEYTTIKHVMFDITGAAQKDWHRTIFTVGK